MRIAEYIVGRLESLGVSHVFGLTGGLGLWLFDAIGRSKIKLVCHHHEQAAAIAADAYARQSGKLGVCVLTGGPGGLNAIMGIAGAYQDSSPVLFLVGQCKRAATKQGSGLGGLRQYGTFEVSLVPIAQSITKFSAALDDPRLAADYLDEAITRARSGRSGPVLLEIPLDVQAAEYAEGGYWSPESRPDILPLPTKDELNLVQEVLKSAERPLLLAGHGIRCAGAVDLFRERILDWGIPVCTTQFAKDLLPYDHPLFVGHPGVRGNRAANFAVMQADVILAIGCSLHEQTIGYDRAAFAPQAKVIAVEPDPAVAKRHHEFLTVKSGVREFLERAEIKDQERACRATRWHSWRWQCFSWKDQFHPGNEPHGFGPPDGPVNIYEFCEVLSELLPDNATIITDSGTSWYAMGQAFRCKLGQRYISSGSLGAMGWAMPACTGAAFADPSRLIVGVTGDGSFQTNVHELAVWAHHGLNVKLFVLDNGGYACIRNTQKAYSNGRFVGVDQASGLGFPHPCDVAQGYGVWLSWSQTRSAMSAIIESTIECSGPVVCQVACHPDQPLLPSVASKQLPDGRMVSARLDEMSPPLAAPAPELLQSSSS